MSPDLIREIARQIVQEQFLYNWVFYTILFALLFLSSFSSAFIRSYGGKRGETYATKADLEQLTVQLRAMTTVTEEVKTSISHTDWASREWKSLRRIKLEELMGQVFAVRDWIGKEERMRFHNESTVSESSPIWKIMTISGLYFPELRDEIEGLNTAYFNYMNWIAITAFKLVETGDNVAQRKIIMSAIPEELKPLYVNLVGAIEVIRRKAPTILQQIVVV
jgi:hypothetical protein